MSARRVRPVAAALIAAVVFASSCDDAPSSTEAPAGDLRAAFLASVGPNVYLPAYQAFAESADALAAAATAWDGQPGSAEPVRAAFASAMGAWQLAETYLAGPAGSSVRYVGGADLRDTIYSWPTTNPCRVDQALAAESYAAGDYLASSLVNGQGLDALGHLIYATDGGNACPAQVRINSEGTWAALGDAAVFARRAAFAKVLADGVVTAAGRLTAAWDATQGNYGAKLASADGYDGQRDALDQVFWGLFYLDRQLKDAKVALPLGLDPSCPSDHCPEAVELAWGALNLAAIRANLVGAKAVFVGEHAGADDAIGFDALLADEGAADLASEMLGQFDAAIAAADAVQGPLAEAVVQRPAQVEALHTAIRAVTTNLKTRFVTVLNLTLPQEGAADND